MPITDHQAKYFAHLLTKEGGEGVERLQQSLLSATVDLNPHQVEAALFALRCTIPGGVLLSDEVGLGKTIEAGLVLCQLWAERKRRLLVLCPASLRKQWQCEIEDKFNLPCLVVDAKSARALEKEGLANPYEKPAVLISSYPYGAKRAEDLRRISWDAVVFDEAHKLRNAYRESNKIGQALRWALEGRRKLLLTATPLQNSLTELYGIATLVDPDAFGDLPSFRSRYANAGGDLEGLKARLSEFSWRTLRRDVEPFVKYTKRFPLTESFECTDLEKAVYDDVSEYLQDEDTYAFPKSQRAMLTLLVRKVLASSSVALAGTLERILARLRLLQRGLPSPEDSAIESIFGDDPDLVDELEEELEEEDAGGDAPSDEAASSETERIDPERLRAEIARVEDLARRVRSIGTDKKTHHLLLALDKGWERLREIGAAEKAVVFTESRRTMAFLRDYLEANGYAGKVVCFSGGGRSDPAAEEIYRRYREAHPDDTASKAAAMRHSLVEHFRGDAQIMIATEAGAEGINLQFCSMVVNYDLPWNPQRVEQRIGRCHRYGQKCDVVVVNFLNTRNAADVRVYELLEQKFRLFEGLFGASNDILGVVDASGKSFERQIHEILQSCRTPAEIAAAFDALQESLRREIDSRMEKTKRDILEHLDEDVRKRLKIDYGETKAFLSDGERRFLALSRQVLATRARFDEGGDALTFRLLSPPAPAVPAGLYTLRRASPPPGAIPYRPNTALGEWAVSAAKALEAPMAELAFDITHHAGRISVVEALKGRSGFLRADVLRLKSLDAQDFVLVSAVTDDGKALAPEVAARFLDLDAAASPASAPPKPLADALAVNAAQYASATAHAVGEANNARFREATERLARWSEDQIAAAAHRIETLRSRRLEVERAIRQARTLDEQEPLQKEFDKVRRELRRARTALFDVEDETDEKRKRLLDALRRRLVPETSRETLFTIRWKVV